MAIAGDRFALKSQTPLLEAKTEMSDGCRGLALRTYEENPRVRAVVVGVLGELPFVCPALVAIGSLIMIGITLYTDWPQ